MSFLAPMFLLGAAAIALPFWLHRLQTQSSEREPFSSTMLLEMTEQRVHVRKQLKYLVLLSLRILLLLLLALAFAKPILTRVPEVFGPTPDGTQLFLVDTSASMDRPGVFDRALDLAMDTLNDAPEGAALQVLSADAELRVASGLSRDHNAAAVSLRGLRPTALRLDFGRAMAAVERLAEELPGPVTLHVFSDFQDSGMPARFADLVSPHVAALVTHFAAPSDDDNWSVDFVRASADGIEAGILGPAGVERQITADLQANGIVVGQRSLMITGSASVHFDPPPLEEGDNRISLTIDVDDALAIDNRRFLVLENIPPVPIPIITLDASGLPVTYLAAALESDPDHAYRVDARIIGDFDVRTLSRYAWVIVDDAGAIDAELAASLEQYVQDGGGLLMFAGLRSATLTDIPILGNGILAVGGSRSAGEFLSIGQVDTGHPLLAHTDGWYSINVSENLPLRVEPADEVLVRLDNGEPFLVERRLGRGRVLLVTGGLENQWNDLPLRPVFVSFLIESARYLSGADDVTRSLVAGSVLPLARAGVSSGQVIDPEGNSVLTLADTTRAQQVELDKTGFYEVYTPENDYIVAVNTDRRESDLGRADEAVLTRWRESMGGSLTPSGVAPADTGPQRIELWHVLLLLLAVVIVVESVLGNVYLSSGLQLRTEAR